MNAINQRRILINSWRLAFIDVDLRLAEFKRKAELVISGPGGQFNFIAIDLHLNVSNRILDILKGQNIAMVTKLCS